MEHVAKSCSLVAELCSPGVLGVEKVVRHYTWQSCHLSMVNNEKIGKKNYSSMLVGKHVVVVDDECLHVQ